MGRGSGAKRATASNGSLLELARQIVEGPPRDVAVEVQTPGGDGRELIDQRI